MNFQQMKAAAHELASELVHVPYGSPAYRTMIAAAHHAYGADDTDVAEHIIDMAEKWADELRQDFAAGASIGRVARLRHNPPLSEHMAHDSLDEIASMLASRIAKAENPDAAFRSFMRDLIREVIGAANLAQDETETPLERTLEAFLRVMFAPKRRY